MIESTEVTKDNKISQESEDLIFKFNPPLYIQRYQYVSDLLKKYNSKTYLDIGCAECKLIRYVKQFNKEVNIIFGIDLDEILLELSKSSLEPLTMDYIRKREKPLEIFLINGDISKPPDNLIDIFSESSLDFVSLVEVIEHMYSDCLEKTVDIVFGRLKPKVICITTPNFEYNDVFNSKEKLLSKDEFPKLKKFRHHDHKFEWTRSEFESWCYKILDKYKNTYEKCIFDGVGDPPSTYSNVGKCSQIAIFVIKNFNDLNNNIETKKHHESILNSHLELIQTTQCSNQIGYLLSSKIFLGSNYKLINAIRYPYELCNENNPNEKLIAELNWLLIFVIKNSNTEVIENEELLNEYRDNDLDVYNYEIQLISIDYLIQFPSIKKYNLNSNEMIDIIRNNKRFKITKSGKYIIYENISDFSSRSDEVLGKDETESNITINDNIEIDLDENWSNEYGEEGIKDNIMLSPEMQFEDANNDKNDNIKDTLQNNLRLEINVNLFDEPNNYYYDEAKLFSKKLRSTRRKLIKNYECEMEKQFEDA